MNEIDYDHFDCIYLVKQIGPEVDPITGYPIKSFYCSHWEILKINPPCDCIFRSCDLRDVDQFNLSLLPN
jgi:hypothetical protein